MRKLIIAMCLLFARELYSQPQPSPQAPANRIRRVASLPSSCTASQVAFRTSDNTYHGCGPDGTWTLMVASGSPGIGGSGTAEFFSLFTASQTLGNGPARYTGNNIFLHPGQPTRTVSIGNDIDIVPSGVLELNSTTRGFVPPRVTTTQRDAMSPFAGWQVYNTTDNFPNFYNGSAWKTLVDTNTAQVLSTKTIFFPTITGGSVAYDGTTSGTLTFAVPATITSHTLTWPSAQGGASTVLTNNGSGTLSWGTGGSGTAPIIQASSKVAVTAGSVFPNVHVSAGAGAKHTDGLGFASGTVITADSTWSLQWDMPPALPTGTANLRIRCIANLSSGTLRLDPQWASCAVNEDCSGLTLQAEGNTDITFTAVDRFVSADVVLNADTIVAGEILVMNLVAKDTGTTTTDTATCKVYIVFL